MINIMNMTLLIILFFFFLDGSGIETMNTEYDQHEKVWEASDTNTKLQLQIQIIHSAVFYRLALQILIRKMVLWLSMYCLL